MALTTSSADRGLRETKALRKPALQADLSFRHLVKGNNGNSGYAFVAMLFKQKCSRCGDPSLPLTSLGIFTSASLFILLRTQQYLAVAGAIRCLSVYWLGRPTADGNKYLLYFVNVFPWTKTLSLVDVSATSAFDFVRLTHWMNALATAGCWLLCYRATESMGTAWAATGAYPFSNAFLRHATRTAEPMMGLLWCFVSILTVEPGPVRGEHYSCLGW